MDVVSTPNSTSTTFLKSDKVVREHIFVELQKIEGDINLSLTDNNEEVQLFAACPFLLRELKFLFEADDGELESTEFEPSLVNALRADLFAGSTLVARYGGTENPEAMGKVSMTINLRNRDRAGRAQGAIESSIDYLRASGEPGLA